MKSKDYVPMAMKEDSVLDCLFPFIVITSRITPKPASPPQRILKIMITLENSKFLGTRKGIDFEFHLLHLKKHICILYIIHFFTRVSGTALLQKNKQQ